MTDEVNTKAASENEAQSNPSGEQAAPQGNAAPSDFQAQLDRLTAEAQINLTGWQRERADFANYKRRIEKEVKESRDRGALEAITEMLPIMDDFELALANIPADLKENAWVSGTALILKKFDKVLDKFSVEVIDPVGQPFDPNRHQAVGTDADTDIPAGHVTVTLRKGYATGDRVLRVAMVKIAD